MHFEHGHRFIFSCLIFFSAPKHCEGISSKSKTFDPKVLKKGYDQVVKERYLDSENKTRIGSKVNLSFLGCVEECLSRGRCKSVSYFSRSLFCHLNYGMGTEGELLGGREDAVYTNVTTDLWDPALIGSCKDHTCAKNEVCKRLSLGRIEYCGPIPSLVNNSRYELPDGISMGNRVFYPCNDGFRPTVDRRKMFGFCRKNGSWSIPNFQCELVYCGQPLAVENASPVQSQVNNYSYGMVVKYACAANYHMVLEANGNAGSVRCRASGQWSKPNFLCKLEVESCDALADIYHVGEDGVYNISKNGTQKEVYCDMSGGNWTVIQRRIPNVNGNDGELFHKSFSEYAQGFGNPHNNGSYWLGNGILSALTASTEYEVMIEIWESGIKKIGHFGKFSILPASMNYTLMIAYPQQGNATVLNDDFVMDNNTVFGTGPSSFLGRASCSGGWWSGVTMCLNCYYTADNCKVKIQSNLNDVPGGKSSLMKIRRRSRAQ